MTRKVRMMVVEALGNYVVVKPEKGEQDMRRAGKRKNERIDKTVWPQYRLLALFDAIRAHFPTLTRRAALMVENGGWI
jgi:hypothetical protein